MAARTFGEAVAARGNNFDAIRFVLAAGVVASHAYGLLGRDADEPVVAATRFQYSGGEMAVDLFFILSGFLIARSWEHSRSLGDYLKKRALRIYPGFVAACLVTLYLFGPLGAADLGAYWGSVTRPRVVPDLANLVLPPTASVFPGQPAPYLNGSLWSIRYEFVCYLLCAALGLSGALRRRGWVAGVFLAAYGLYGLQLFGWCRSEYHPIHLLTGSPNTHPRTITCFLAGVLAYLYRDRIPMSRGVLAAGLGACLIAAPLARFQALRLVFPVAGAYAAFYAGFQHRVRVHHFARYGDLSYGVYLYSWPIEQLLIRFGVAGGPPALAVSALAVSSAFAFASWHLVESPFLRLKRPARSGSLPAAALSAPLADDRAPTAPPCPIPPG